MAIVPPHTHPRHEHRQYADAADLSALQVATAALRGRNRIINGDFSVNQRAFTSTTTTAIYGFDRWRNSISDGTVTYSKQAPALGDLPESANAFARIVTTGQTLAGAAAILLQKIESVRTLSGKTVTVSFWAKAAAGAPKVAVEFEQLFGTGGSPSATVQTYAGQVTLTTSWARYSVTVAIPSVAGKTLGTDGNDSLILQLWTSAGSTYNAITGSLGIQSATIDFWGVQVEEGSYATPFEQKSYAQELRDCQRYFQRLYFPPLRGVCTAAGAGRMAMPLPVEMRMVPATGTFNDLANAPIYDGTAVKGFASVTGWFNTTKHIELDAALTGGAFSTPGRACLLYNSAGGTSVYLDLSTEL